MPPLNLLAVTQLEHDYLYFHRKNDAKKKENALRNIETSIKKSGLNAEETQSELNRSLMRRHINIAMDELIILTSPKQQQANQQLIRKQIRKLFQGLSDLFTLLARNHASENESQHLYDINRVIKLMHPNVLQGESELTNSCFIDYAGWITRAYVTSTLTDNISGSKENLLASAKLRSYNRMSDKYEEIIATHIQMLEELRYSKVSKFHIYFSLAMEYQHFSERILYDYWMVLIRQNIDEYSESVHSGKQDHNPVLLRNNLELLIANANLSKQYQQKANAEKELHIELFECEYAIKNNLVPHRTVAEKLAFDAKAYEKISLCYSKLAAIHSTLTVEDLRKNIQFNASAAVTQLEVPIRERLSSLAKLDGKDVDEAKKQQIYHALSLINVEETLKSAEQLCFYQPFNVNAYHETLDNTYQRLLYQCFLATNAEQRQEVYIQVISVTAAWAASLQFSLVPNKKLSTRVHQIHRTFRQDALNAIPDQALRKHLADNLVLLSPKLSQFDFDECCMHFKNTIKDGLKSTTKPILILEGLAHFCRELSEIFCLRNFHELLNKYVIIVAQYLETLNINSVEAWYHIMISDNAVEFMNTLTCICARPSILFPVSDDPENDNENSSVDQQDRLTNVLTNTKTFLTATTERLRMHLVNKGCTPKEFPKLLDESHFLNPRSTFDVTSDMKTNLHKVANDIENQRFHFLSPPRHSDVEANDPEDLSEDSFETIPLD